MHLRLVRTALAALSLLSAPALADWTGGIEGGTVSRGGENATRLRVRLEETARPLTQSLYAEWLSYADGSGYRAGYVPRYWFDPKLYAFAEAEGRVDRPLRIDRGARLLGGVGYRLHDDATTGLGIELGVGGRSTRFEPLPGESEGREDDEGLALVRVAAFRELAELIRLELDAEALQGTSLGEQRADASLAYRVAGGAIRLGVRYARVSFDEGDAIDDTQRSVSFTYGF